MARSIAIRTHSLLPASSQSVKGFFKLHRGIPRLQRSYCCHISQLPQQNAGQCSLSTSEDNHPHVASHSSQCLIYVHLNYILLKDQSSTAGFSIIQELVLPIPSVLLDLLPLIGFPLLTQGQITPVILSLDAFISGTCSQLP